MNEPKTIFCDIDGTLIPHEGVVTQQHLIRTTLPNAVKQIKEWEHKGYKIILTTGRKSCYLAETEQQLKDLQILYDELIMDLPRGDRILINDKKHNCDRDTAYSISPKRNNGLKDLDVNELCKNSCINSVTEKPWGREELLECNGKYVVKKLLMNKGECCSLQYHELKRETVYILSGKIKLYIGSENQLEVKTLSVGDHITIEPFTVHRMEGIEDSYYLECSTCELWDVVRLQDKYKR
jgi:mannose-6-phosphate isomerase